jgi:hypothetical protein
MLSHLKKHGRSWFISLLAVAIACLTVWFSEAFQQCMNQSHYESSDYEPEKGVAQIITALGWGKTCSGYFLKEDGDAITAFFTLVLGISTIGLWLSTQNLWKVTDATLDHAQDTARKQLRAYIGVEPRGVKKWVGKNEIIGHIAIRNVGGVPAKNIAMYTITDWSKDGSRKNFHIGQLYKSQTSVAPKTEMIFGTASGTEIFGDEVLVMSARGGYVFVFGKVTYTDEFGTDGWTLFCHRYPCEMINEDYSISRAYGRYHELAGNEAG